MTDLLGSGIAAPDPGAVQQARSQSLGDMMKGASPAPAAAPPEAFRSGATPDDRSTALAGVGLGVLGGSSKWDETKTTDPYALAQSLSPGSGSQHLAALAGFANGLGGRLQTTDSWTRKLTGVDPGAARPVAAATTFGQFRSLVQQGIAGKTLQPYADTMSELQNNAPALLSTASGAQRAQDLQDFLYRLSQSSTDWAPSEWRPSAAWKVAKVEQGDDGGIEYVFSNEAGDASIPPPEEAPRQGFMVHAVKYSKDRAIANGASGSDAASDPTLAATVRQMPTDDLAPAVKGAEKADQLQIHSTSNGVRLVGPVGSKTRSQLRMLYPTSDPLSGSPDAAYAPVSARPVANIEDHLHALFVASGEHPQTGELFSDPSMRAHPAVTPGSHVLVKAALKDQGALSALQAHLRDTLGLDPKSMSTVNGPVRMNAAIRPVEPSFEDEDTETPGQKYSLQPTPQRSLVVHLGDGPDDRLVQSVWDAVAQVAGETGKEMSPTFYGMGDARVPTGAVQIGEHLFQAKGGTVVVPSGAFDPHSTNSVPAWVPADAAEHLPQATRLQGSVTNPEYTMQPNPDGSSNALADNAFRVQYSHLAPVGQKPDVRLAADISKSKVYGHTPQYLAVYLPEGGVPAVSFGVHGPQQADAGLQALSPTPGHTVHVQLGRTANVLDAPNELVGRAAVAALRRLGVSAPIRFDPAKAVAA